MTRSLVLYAATGKAHIVQGRVTLCGHRLAPLAAWYYWGPWTAREIEGLCKSCRTNAERSPDVVMREGSR